MHRLIGKGAFGQVYEATIGHAASPKYAVKVVDKLLLNSPEMLKRVRNEISIHRILRHPNILRLFHHFDDYKAVYLVMELCQGGELYHLLKQQRTRGIEERVARRYFADIVRGLNYLHNTMRIIHRDLKLSNILLYIDSDQQTIAKIGDFGLACYQEGADTLFQNNNVLNMTICGTPNYLAPEVVQKRPYGREADLWSLGCLLYAMLVGRAPFEGHSLRSTFDKVVAGVYSVPEWLSPAARDLVGQLMQTEPRSRPTIASLLEHPFVTNRPLFGLSTDDTTATNMDCINTKYLKPIKQLIKHGCIEIDAAGTVTFTVDSDRSVMRVSGDGQHVTFTDAHNRTESCLFGELGKAAKKRYDYMKRFVDLVRSKTPLMVLRHDLFKVTVYSAHGWSSVEMNVYNVPLSFKYDEQQDTITTNSNNNKQHHHYYHPTTATIQSIDDPITRKWLLEFTNRLQQLRRVHAELPRDYTHWPFVIDETRQRLSSPSLLTVSSVTEGTGEWSALSGLRPSNRALNARFVAGCGWRVSVGDGHHVYLLVDGRQCRHDPVLNRVSEDDGVTWRSLHVADPLFPVTRLFL